MPRWIIDTLTAIFSVATLAVAWTWIQAWLNYRAVKGVDNGDDLRDYARNVLYKETAVLIAQVSITLVGILSMPIPRQEWMRTVSQSLLVVMALALVAISFHEYLGMRSQLRDYEHTEYHRRDDASPERREPDVS